jgi:hypothetical protein
VINEKDFSLGASSTDTSQCIGAIVGMDIQDADGEDLAILGGTFFIFFYSRLLRSILSRKRVLMIPLRRNRCVLEELV